LFVDTTDILTERPDRDKLNAAEKKDCEDRRGVTGVVVSCEQLDKDLDDRNHERDKRNGETQIGRKAQRNLTEARDAVDREAQHLRHRIFRRSGKAFVTIVLDADLRVTHPAHESAQKAMPLSRQLECFDNPPAHQPEVARVDGDRYIRQAPNDAIKRARRYELERPLAFARAPRRINDVVAFSPAFQKRTDQFGRILQIAVHQHDRIPPRGIDARRRSELMAEVPRQVDDDDLVVRQCKVAKPQQRCVARAVVHQDQLVTRRSGQLAHDAADTPHQFVDVAFFVEDRDDDRDQLR